MTARLMTLLVWAAVLASAVAWAMPLFTTTTAVPPGTVVAQPTPPAGASLVRLLGEPPAEAVAVDAGPAPVVDGRYRLVGVVAPRSGAPSGLALISVDGKPARAVPVGRELAPGLRLLTVGHRQAELGPARGSPAMTLALVPAAGAAAGMPPGQYPGAFPGQMPGQIPGLRLPAGRAGLPANGMPQPMPQPMPQVQPGAPYPGLQPAPQPEQAEQQMGDPGPAPTGLNADGTPILR